MIADMDMPFSITLDFNFVVGAENIEAYNLAEDGVDITDEYAIKKAIKMGSDLNAIGFYYNKKTDGSQLAKFFQT